MEPYNNKEKLSNLIDNMNELYLKTCDDIRDYSDPHFIKSFGTEAYQDVLQTKERGFVAMITVLAEKASDRYGVDAASLLIAAAYCINHCEEVE